MAFAGAHKRPRSFCMVALGSDCAAAAIPNVFAPVRHLPLPIRFGGKIEKVLSSSAFWARLFRVTGEPRPCCEQEAIVLNDC
jgi:hypothetical protein